MTRIVHFGPGNFFRAHLAEYTADALDWDITVVSLRSAAFRDAWAKSGRYTLVVHGQASRAIDVISDVLVAPEDPGAVVQAMCDPATQVISATVTEKGYHLGPDGALNLQDPAIAAELHTGQPATLIGYLAHALAQRSAPVTVLSCDNRVSNGDVLGQAVRDFARAAGLEIACDVTFPNCMVDRITPATTAELIDETGDPLSVPCEPFKEWVIEDRFAAQRPAWPDVQWVDDVAPHELRKLRMLNGAHSFLAYAGVLAGHRYVHEAVSDPKLRAAAKAVMGEAAETLPEPVRNQAPSYAAALLARFDNPHVRHELRQIAMDGTQKLPYRCLTVIRERGAERSPAQLGTLRAWVQFVQAEVRAGRDLQDPRADELARANTTKKLLDVLNASDLSDAVSPDA